MQRRAFLTALAALVAGRSALRGEAVAPWAGARALAQPIGIQLYTLRRLLGDAAERTLAALAAIGYEEVELAGLHGSSPAAWRAMLDRQGLRAPAGHVPLSALRPDPRRALDEAAALGQTFVVVPWIDQADRTLDGYRRIAAHFNEAGEAARRVGLRLAYHNHDFEFAPVGGVVPFDVLLAETDPSLVSFELDLFWIRRGGHDALVYFERHPGRFALVHVKDMSADGRMVDVGAGEIDFARVVAASPTAGIRHYFIEHDDPAEPLAFARASYAHMRSLLR
jgi:sugar phosphate isomerase/epimerase